MTPAIWDHVLAAVLLLVVPIYGRFAYRILRRKLAAGDPDARRAEYVGTIVFEWALCAIVVAAWLLASRPLAVLGFALPPGWRTIAGAAVTAAGLAFLLFQWRAVGRLDAGALDKLRAQVVSVAEMMPRTEREHRWFRAVALTAGIVEEVVYRGYLIAYLAAFLGTPAATVTAAVAFGLAHAYQGRAGIVKTGVAGLIAAVLYVTTGSLLWPIVLHAAVDLQGGAIGRRVLASS